MSSLTLRKCNSEKACTSCSKTILIGEVYHSGSYKSLCVACYEKEKKEAIENKVPEDNSYIVSAKCNYCDQPAIGALWQKPVCAAHINQVITEYI